MYNTTDHDVELLRIYDAPSLYEPCEREQTRFWDSLKEADDVSPRGKGLFYRVTGNSGWSVNTPDEEGDFPEHNTPDKAELQVTSAQIAAGVSISAKFLEAGKQDGSYGGDPEHEAIVSTTRNLFAYADILMGVGHGTGRLGVIADNETASDTITLDIPEKAYQIRPGMRLETANLDTGGTVQDTDLKVLSVDYNTGIVTLDQDVTVVAGWGVYKSGDYGTNKPDGARNIVDDGDFATSIGGASRVTNPFLNAIVLDGGNATQDYSEELVRSLLDQITLAQDLCPTELRCNNGIANEHLRVTTPDRVYNIDSSGKAPNYSGGANQEALFFQYADKRIPLKIDRNYPARELYALHRPSWRKHTLRKADWFRGPGGKILHVKPAEGGGTLSFALIGAMLLDMTVSCRRFNAQGKLSNVRDRTHGGDE